MKTTPYSKARRVLDRLPSSRRNRLAAVSVACLVLAIGFVVLMTNAATPFAALEAESGSMHLATTVSDESASGGAALKFGSGTSGTPNPPASWQEAFNSRNQAALDAWYAANTGYAALGYDSADFWNISGNSYIDDKWLNANKNNGYVKQSGDRWIIEKVRSSNIGIATNNVTIRGCLISAGGGHIYGIQHAPTWDNTVTGTVVEYCTVDGGGSDSKGILLYSKQAGITTAIVRNNDIFKYGTGLDIRGNTTAEYNRVHDLHYSTGSHNASASNRAANVRILRNSFEDGNSSALSIYADSHIYNMIVQENIFNTPNANYCINFPNSKQYYDQTYDTHLIDNLFGQKHYPKCGSSGPMAGGNWTTKSGNVYMDGTVAIN